MISRRPAAECTAAVDSMVTSMAHEDFYRTGTHTVPQMGLYAGWVALDDSPNAHQVFCNEEKNIALLFSGECYADPSVKSELRSKQHQFNDGQADWLVHFYEEKGEGFFEKLNGLFSGVLIDRRTGQIFLFNDRYGIERIYFHESKDAFYFASEAKALLAVVPELRAFDLEGVTQFLTYGCTLNWKTLFTGVELMPGGSLWKFENHVCSKKRYFSPESWEAQGDLPAETFEANFQETFRHILPRYFETDSRVGISLTAGLDTRMIMSCLPGHIDKPVCYTYAEADNETLDARLAATVARACGLEHRLLRLGPDFFENFAAHADRTVQITDGCYGILGSHEIFLNRLARQCSTVRITGNFGSEILRGVSVFKPGRLLSQLMSPELRTPVAECLGNGECPNRVNFAAFKEVPWRLYGSLCASRSQVTFRTPYLDNEMVALAFRAPPFIRGSARSALKTVNANNKALGAIPTDKGLLMDAAGPAYMLRCLREKVFFKLDYYYNEGMPHALAPLDTALSIFGGRVLGRHIFLHYRRWFRRELAEYIRSALNDPSVVQNPLWNQDVIRSLADDHISGRRNYLKEINAVLTLSAIDRLIIRKDRS